MANTIPLAERRRLAEMAGIDPVFLYQCLTGFRSMNPADARRCETLTNGQLKRWDLCRQWHEIWPELIGTEGAPRVKRTKQAA